MHSGPVKMIHIPFVSMEEFILETKTNTTTMNEIETELGKQNGTVKPKPNDLFVYSCHGYILPGQLIENVSGMTDKRYLDKVDKYL